MLSEKEFAQLLKDSDTLPAIYSGNCDFDGAMYCRTSRDVLKEQAQRIAALESQLAAQTSAVEVLGNILKAKPDDLEAQVWYEFDEEDETTGRLLLRGRTNLP